MARLVLPALLVLCIYCSQTDCRSIEDPLGVEKRLVEEVGTLQKIAKGLLSIRAQERSNEEKIEKKSETSNKEVIGKRDHDVTKRDHDVTKRDHDVTKRDHDVTKRDHDANKRDHDATKRDHDATKRDHDATKRDHDATKRDHDATKRDHDATKRDHDTTKRDHDHDATKRDHDVTKRDHDATKRDHDATKRDHDATKRDHDASKIDLDQNEEKRDEEKQVERKKRGCASNPCVNGDCSEEDKPLASEGLDYVCICPAGFGGWHCEIDNPCKTCDGICLESNVEKDGSQCFGSELNPSKV